MATNIYGSANFSTKTDEEYFICFYEEELKTYLPPRHKTKSIDRIPEIDLQKALKKWYDKHIFNKNHLNNDHQKSDSYTYRLIVKSLDILTEYQLENIKIHAINVSNTNCELIKRTLLDYNRKQCLKILYYIKNYDSIENKSEMLTKQINNIFVNKEANDWFLKTLESKFDIKNGNIRGLNAFVNALISNNHVQTEILLKSFTQKKLVEYLNTVYNKELIKNHTKLSNKKNYDKEVNKLILDHLESEKSQTRRFFSPLNLF